MNLEPKSPHSAGCRATPGKGAMALDSTREIGEDGGVMVDPPEELESKLPVDEQEPPREDKGRIEELESLFWQL